MTEDNWHDPATWARMRRESDAEIPVEKRQYKDAWWDAAMAQLGGPSAAELDAFEGHRIAPSPARAARRDAVSEANGGGWGWGAHRRSNPCARQQGRNPHIDIPPAFRTGGVFLHRSIPLPNWHRYLMRSMALR